MLVLMSREAVRKIRSVFRELYLGVLTENEALKDKVRQLEGEEPQNQNSCAAVKNRRVPKVRPSGEAVKTNLEPSKHLNV